MNSSNLPINRVGGDKVKNFTFERLKIPLRAGLAENELFESFMEAASGDGQLLVLKRIVNEDGHSEDVVKFLVDVFLGAPSKHPIKSFLVKHVTRTEHIQNQFTNQLTRELDSLCSSENSNYEDNAVTVTRLLDCIENFPVGQAAVKSRAENVSRFLTDCLSCCTDKLGNQLTSTERNDVYTRIHSILRLLLFIMQKIKEDNLVNATEAIKNIGCMRDTLFKNDVPMDTKSVYGICLITRYILENGPNSWIDVLTKHETRSELIIDDNDSSVLSVYAGLATVVPFEQLQDTDVQGKPALLVILQTILDVEQRNPFEGSLVLGVSRAVLHISKGVSIWRDVAPLLIAHVWTHLDHHMDSVRHIPGQLLDNILAYCARMNEQGDEEPLNDLFESIMRLDQQHKSYYIALTSLANALGVKYLFNKYNDHINKTQIYGCFRSRDLIDTSIRALNNQEVQASIGKSKDYENKVAGKYGQGERSKRGESLIQYAYEHNLKILNTMFKIKGKNRWTWISPDKNTKNEIDYILSTKPHIFSKYEVLSSFSFG